MEGLSSLPKGQLDFRHAMSHLDGNVSVKRGDDVLTMAISTEPYRLGFLIAGKDLLLGILALLIALYAKPSRIALAAAATLFLFGATGEGAHIGPTAAATHVLTITNILSQVILWPSLTITILLILKSNASRAQLYSCWVAAVLGCALANI